MVACGDVCLMFVPHLLGEGTFFHGSAHYFHCWVVVFLSPSEKLFALSLAIVLLLCVGHLVLSRGNIFAFLLLLISAFLLCLGPFCIILPRGDISAYLLFVEHFFTSKWWYFCISACFGHLCMSTYFEGVMFLHFCSCFCIFAALCVGRLYIS